jgi:hypothetical protein
MGLFFEVIIVGVAVWWLGLAALRAWRARPAEGSAEPGSHDAGVWVNEPRWMQIVAELEEELKRGDQGGNPHRGRQE